MFLVGHHLGARAMRLRWVAHLLTPRRYALVQQKFERYGNRLMFFARFLPGLRTAVFLTAGMTHRVSFARFLALDGLAALISVPIWVYLGFYGAENREWLLHWIKRGQGVITSRRSRPSRWSPGCCGVVASVATNACASIANGARIAASRPIPAKTGKTSRRRSRRAFSRSARSRPRRWASMKRRPRIRWTARQRDSHARLLAEGRPVEACDRSDQCAVEGIACTGRVDGATASAEIR